MADGYYGFISNSQIVGGAEAYFNGDGDKVLQTMVECVQSLPVVLLLLLKLLLQPPLLPGGNDKV